MRKIDSLTWQQNAASLYAWMSSLGFSLLYIWFSKGGLSWINLVVGLSLSGAVLLLPTLLAKMIESKGVYGDTILWDQLLTVLFLFVLAIMGFCPPSFFVAGSCFVFILLCFSVFHAIKQYIKRFKASYSLILLLMIIVQIIVVSRISYTAIRAYPDALNHLLLGINISQDHLFYAAIAAMLKSHYMVTGGLNGLVHLRTYWGALLLVAGFSNWLNLGTMDAPTWLMTVVLVPIFFKQCILIAMRISALVSTNYHSKQYYTPFILIVFLLTLLLANFSNKFTLWQSMVSQNTNLCSLDTGLIMAGVLFYLLKDVRKTEQFNPVKLGIIVVVLPILLFLIGWTKTSNMLIAGALYGFLWLRFGLFRKTSYNLSLLISAASAFLVHVLFLPVAYGGSMKIELFDFYKVWVHDVPAFIVVYFSYFWFYLILRMIDNPHKATGHMLKDKSLFDLEFGLVSAIICVVPSCIFVVGGGSGIYFLAPFRLTSMFLFFFVCYRCILEVFINKSHDLENIKNNTENCNILLNK